MLPSEFTYLALFLLLLVQESGIPLWPPGYAMLVILGFRAAQGNGNAPFLIGMAALANFLGASIVYRLGRWIGYSIVIRYGRRLGVTESRLAQAGAWLQRFGVRAILAGRLLPGLRIPTALVAGLLEIRYPVFAPAAALAGALWAGFYTTAGFFAARLIPEPDLVHIQNVPLPSELTIALLIGLFCLTLIHRRRRPALR